MIIIHIRKTVPTIHIAKTACQHWPILELAYKHIILCVLLTDVLLLQPCKRVPRRPSLLLIQYIRIALIIDIASAKQLDPCADGASKIKDKQNEGKQQYDAREEAPLGN
jgi:hypothetical protein